MTSKVINEAFKAISEVAESIDTANLPEEVEEKINRIRSIARYNHDIPTTIEIPMSTPSTTIVDWRAIRRHNSTSNQTRRKVIEDAVTKRQDYIWKKATISGSLFFHITLVITCIVVSVLSFSAGDSTPGLFLFIMALVGIFFGASSAEEAKALTYVPPVGKQFATLPAKEVLLRASDEPEANPDELVRPAAYSEMTPAEELLRAAPGGDGEPVEELLRADQVCVKWIPLPVEGENLDLVQLRREIESRE